MTGCRSNKPVATNSWASCRPPLCLFARKLAGAKATNIPALQGTRGLRSKTMPSEQPSPAKKDAETKSGPAPAVSESAPLVPAPQKAAVRTSKESFTWVYRMPASSSRSWRAFRDADIMRLEAASRLGQKTCTVDFGRRLVDLEKRLLMTQFWESTPCEVRRATWFRARDGEPFSERVAAKIETMVRHANPLEELWIDMDADSKSQTARLLLRPGAGPDAPTPVQDEDDQEKKDADTDKGSASKGDGDEAREEGSSSSGKGGGPRRRDQARTDSDAVAADALEPVHKKPHKKTQEMICWVSNSLLPAAVSSAAAPSSAPAAPSSSSPATPSAAPTAVPAHDLASSLSLPKSGNAGEDAPPDALDEATPRTERAGSPHTLDSEASPRSKSEARDPTSSQTQPQPQPPISNFKLYHRNHATLSSSTVTRDPPRDATVDLRALERDETAKVSHLVLVVHGVGEALYKEERFASEMGAAYSEKRPPTPPPQPGGFLMATRHIVESVDELRLSCDRLRWTRDAEEGAGQRLGRIEFLPVEWHRNVRDDRVLETLRSITLSCVYCVICCCRCCVYTLPWDPSTGHPHPLPPKQFAPAKQHCAWFSLCGQRHFARCGILLVSCLAPHAVRRRGGPDEPDCGRVPSQPFAVAPAHLRDGALARLGNPL